MQALLVAYRRVLANRPLTALLFGEFISSIGDWLYLVALLIIIYDRTEDAVLLGVVGAARVLPYVFLSIPAGILADRIDRRMILLVTDLCRGALMLVLAWLVATKGSIELIVAVTILATCFSAFFGPAIGAYLPSLVRDEADLGPANTVYSTLENLAFIVGPALAAVIISVGDLVAAFVLNAVSFAVVAAVLWRLPPSRAKQASQASTAAGPTGETLPTAAAGSVEAEDAGTAVAAGFAWRDVAVPLVALMTLDLVESFIFGGLGVLTVVIAFDRLGIGDEGTGLLNAAVGVGGLIGALISGALILRRRLGPPMLLGALILGASVAALGLTAQLGVALAAFALSALGSLLVSIVATTLFQRIVPDAVRGRTLGVLETVSVLAYAGGALVLPALTQSLGIERVLVVCGIAMAVAAVVAVPLLGKHAIQTPVPDPVRATLGKVPLFAGLGPTRLEIAERRARIVPMAPGEGIIRQGDPADRFYVIVEGEVEVTQIDGGERRVLRRMGEREFFGEIGLLSGVPRTATVTAVTPGTLLALDKQDFLDLVSGGSGLTFPLLDVHRGATVSGG